MNYFVNENLDKAIDDYLRNKNNKDGVLYNSVPVLIVRTLVFIYGELDIITPYSNKDVVAFHDNLLKFNFSKFKLNQFFNEVRLLTDAVDTNANILNIEKFLIDMLMAKKVFYEVSDSDLKTFEELLIYSKNMNPLISSYDFLYRLNDGVIRYFVEQNTLCVKVSKETPKTILSPEAYKVVNWNYTDVCALSAPEIDKINNLVYKGLNIDKNAVNFDYLYDLALFNHYNKNEYITGNGYVDILLLMSIISTCVMIIFILVFIVFL